jgi:signal transduction histidine kinase
MELAKIPNTIFNEKEIRQLVLNLVRNGMEAMESPGLIAIKTYSSSDNIILEVSDTGKGIPSDLLDKIGTPFFSTKENGTGLGLAVCYRIAQRHKARIEVISYPGCTTFSVKFVNTGIGELSKQIAN